MYNFAALQISFANSSLSIFLLIRFFLSTVFGQQKRRTTKVIRRIFYDCVLYAGCQPRCLAEYHKVLVITLPSRSTALMCRHMETFLVHLYYTQIPSSYQLILKYPRF